MYMRVAFWCCLSTKVEAHQALPCAAIVRTMYEHMQLQKLACLHRKHDIHVSRQVTPWHTPSKV